MSPKKIARKRSSDMGSKTHARTSSRKSSGREFKESRTAYRSATVSLEELNRNLLQLQSGLGEIQQRLAMFEAQLSTLSETQRRIAASATTTRDDLGWLRLSEASFAFWNNAEDEIYDTL